MMNGRTSTRRELLLALLGGVVSVARPRALWAAALRSKPVHPTPRKGITGAKVAAADMLRSSPHLLELFDGVRAIPHVADGIRCHCGCADLDGHYSLLTCYEGEDAMAKICPICQGMGRVAVRMAKAGRSLDDIRAAVDAQYG
jgi:hypothetical protein